MRERSLLFSPRVDAVSELQSLYNLVPPRIVVEPSYIVFQRDGVVYAKNGLTGEIEFRGTDASQVIQKAIDALGEDGGMVHIKAGTYNLASTVVVKPNVWLTGEGTATTLYTESDITLIHVSPEKEHVVTRVEGLRLFQACEDPTQPAMVVTGWVDRYWDLATSVVVRDIIITRPGTWEDFDQAGIGLELRLSRDDEVIYRSVFENLRIRRFGTGLLFNFQNPDANVWNNVFSNLLFIDNLCDIKTTGEEYGFLIYNRFLFPHFCGYYAAPYCAVDFSSPVMAWMNLFYGCIFENSPRQDIVKMGPNCRFNLFVVPFGYLNGWRFVSDGEGNSVLDVYHNTEYKDLVERSTTSTTYEDATLKCWLPGSYGPMRVMVDGSFELRSSSSAATAYARIVIYDERTVPPTLITSTEVSTNSTEYQSFRRVLATDLPSASVHTYLVAIEFCTSDSAYPAFIRNKVLRVKVV